MRHGRVVSILIIGLITHTARPAFTQSGSKWLVGGGLGASLVTGTPDQPLPADGEVITGAAGPDVGIHGRFLVERGTGWRWLNARAEIFANRLISGPPTINCFTKRGSPPRNTCFPAADTDFAIGITVGGRLRLPDTRLHPSLVAAAGFAKYTLSPDPWFEELDGSSAVRPVVKGGLATEMRTGNCVLIIEATLEASTGRGGGSHHIPITLSFLF